MTEPPDDLTFSVDSRLLEELGENLITRNHVAVAELVKNSYDADATEAVIRFIDSKGGDPSDGEIQIIDDGTGMALEDVRDGWMRIATTDKIQHPTTKKYGREKAGDKGIGRFACRRLAHVLDLETTAYLEEEDVYETVSLTIDWRDYKRDQEIEEVTFTPDVKRVSGNKDLDTGVKLRLSDLQDNWTERDFNTLRRNVISLSAVEPKRRQGYEEDPGFDIHFDAPEFDKGKGTLAEQIHEAGWGCLTGEIGNDGTVELNLNAKKIGERNYKFSANAAGLSGTSFKISYIPRRKKHFRDTQTLSLERAKQINENHGGVRVYMGGFRVFSYGGPEDDWLGIDQYAASRKTRPDEQFDNLSDSIEFHSTYDRAMLVHPKNEQLIGRVMISNDADITMQANREGFVDDELFEDLKDILKLGLQWMTLQYSNYKAVQSQENLEEQTEKFKKELERDKSTSNNDTNNSENSTKEESQSKLTEQDGQSTEYESDAKSDDAPVDSAVQLLEEVADTATETLPEEERTVSDEAVDTATRVIRNSLDQKEQQIDFFRSAFSVNQVIFGFSHELRSMINNLGTSASRIENVIDDIPKEHRSQFKGVADDLRDMQARFGEQMTLFGIFMETSNRKRPDEIRVVEVAETVQSATSFIADYYNASVEVEVSDILLTPPMYESELYSILLNLVTNSIKAVGSANVNDGRVLISGEETNDGIRLRVLDNGVGIPQGYQDDIFEPLVSDPANNLYESLAEEMPEELSEQLGKGTGLGLSIIQNIAQKYDGTARVVDNEDWSTCIEVTLNE